MKENSKSEKESLYCHLCNTQTNLKVDSFTRYHLRLHHPEVLSMKQYYDLTVKTPEEGICVCGKETDFYSYNRGYALFCSNKCSTTSDYMKNKISDSCKTRDYKMVKVKFNKTCMDRYGVSAASQRPEHKDKVATTMVQKYGERWWEDTLTRGRITIAENYDAVNDKRKLWWQTADVETINQNRKESNLKNHGVEYMIHLDEVREKHQKSLSDPNVQAKTRKTNEEVGRWIPLDRVSNFQLYRMAVDKETRKWKSELFSSWDGLDYYSRESLSSLDKEYVEYDALQPTIDHKISVYYGFANSIPPEVIGHIDNLCVCGRKLNSIKNYLTEQEFRETAKCPA